MVLDFSDSSETFNLLKRNQLEELNQILISVQPSQSANDSFVWRSIVPGLSTSSSYNRLISHYNDESYIEPLVLKGLATIWRSKVPNKVQYLIGEPSWICSPQSWIWQEGVFFKEITTLFVPYVLVWRKRVIVFGAKARWLMYFFFIVFPLFSL